MTGLSGCIMAPGAERNAGFCILTMKTDSPGHHAQADKEKPDSNDQIETVRESEAVLNGIDALHRQYLRGRGILRQEPALPYSAEVSPVIERLAVSRKSTGQVLDQNVETTASIGSPYTYTQNFNRPRMHRLSFLIRGIGGSGSSIDKQSLLQLPVCMGL